MGEKGMICSERDRNSELFFKVMLHTIPGGLEASR